MGMTRKNLDVNIEDEDIHFITSVQKMNSPGIYQHSGNDISITRKTDEVKKDFSIILQQLNYIITEADQGSEGSGFKLDEVTISLGFSAKGKIAFIAEAGVEASIEVKFTRKTS